MLDGRRRTAPVAASCCPHNGCDRRVSLRCLSLLTPPLPRCATRPAARSLPRDDPEWLRRTGARAQLYAAGYKQDDFKKPIITVAAPYMSYNMCNQKFRQLADECAAELTSSGAMPFVSHQPVISDGQTMGSEGMRYSLISRDVIADCIEVMHNGYLADGMITLSGCDKTHAGVLMPIVRDNNIGITLCVRHRYRPCTHSDSVTWLQLPHPPLRFSCGH